MSPAVPHVPTFAGTVVATGTAAHSHPDADVVLDDGEAAVAVATEADLHLGQFVAVTGDRDAASGLIDAESAVVLDPREVDLS